MSSRQSREEVARLLGLSRSGARSVDRARIACGEDEIVLGHVRSSKHLSESQLRAVARRRWPTMNRLEIVARGWGELADHLYAVIGENETIRCRCCGSKEVKDDGDLCAECHVAAAEAMENR